MNEQGGMVALVTEADIQEVFSRLGHRPVVRKFLVGWTAEWGVYVEVDVAKDLAGCGGASLRFTRVESLKLWQLADGVLQTAGWRVKEARSRRGHSPRFRIRDSYKELLDFVCSEMYLLVIEG